MSVLFMILTGLTCVGLLVDVCTQITTNNKQLIWLDLYVWSSMYFSHLLMRFDFKCYKLYQVCCTRCVYLR